MQIKNLIHNGLHCTEICALRILIVDDEFINLMALEGIILGLNQKVYSCDTGVEAIKLFKQRLLNKCCDRKFDLILTDI